jgi:hypothetical protein
VTLTFYSFTAAGVYNECLMDKDGRYLMLVENTVAGPAPNGDENLYVDMQTNAQVQILDNNGAFGHADAGHGYFLGLDNWNNLPGAVTSFTSPSWTVQGGLSVRTPHYRAFLETVGGTWSGFNPMNHPSHNNARPIADAPKASQYFCGSDADLIVGWQNEIVCSRLDFSGQQLIVAPVMTDLNASGGGVAANGCFDNTYCKYPFFSIDRTGEWGMWTTNMGVGRLDAYLVHIPKQLLDTVDIVPPAPPTGVRIQ